jgi:hypothetical protein
MRRRAQQQLCENAFAISRSWHFTSVSSSVVVWVVSVGSSSAATVREKQKICRPPACVIFLRSVEVDNVCGGSGGRTLMFGRGTDY